MKWHLILCKSQSSIDLENSLFDSEVLNAKTSELTKTAQMGSRNPTISEWIVWKSWSRHLHLLNCAKKVSLPLLCEMLKTTQIGFRESHDYGMDRVETLKQVSSTVELLQGRPFGVIHQGRAMSTTVSHSLSSTNVLGIRAASNPSQPKTCGWWQGMGHSHQHGMTLVNDAEGSDTPALEQFDCWRYLLQGLDTSCDSLKPIRVVLSISSIEIPLLDSNVEYAAKNIITALSNLKNEGRKEEKTEFCEN